MNKRANSLADLARIESEMRRYLDRDDLSESEREGGERYLDSVLGSIDRAKR